jgi:hypothetical protein
MNHDALRIYAGHAAIGSGPRRPARSSPSPSRAEVAIAVVPTGELAIVDQLRAVIERPALYGESVNDGFVRKERELAALFRTLAVPVARALLSRLSDPRVGDAAADAFARLAAGRRRRLLAVLEHVAHGAAS